MLTTSLLPVCPRPIASVDPTHCGPTRSKLARWVQASFGEKDHVRGDCASRPFESAIALAVLNRIAGHDDMRRRAADYCRAVTTDHDVLPFDRILASGALGELIAPDVSAAAIDELLAEFDHFTARRKRVFFSVLMGAIDGRMPDLGLPPSAFTIREDQQAWIAPVMASLGVLYARGHGDDARVDAAQLRLLRETLRDFEANRWERYLPGVLLAMLALANNGHDDELVDRCLARIQANQGEDGGFPFIGSMEIFATVTAGLGLVGAVQDPVLLRRVADHVALHQQSDGGWAYAHGVRQTDLDDTSYCLEFLRAVDPLRHRHSIGRAENYLVASQTDDGGFPTFPGGRESEPAMTAAALNALAPSARRHPEVLERGIRYLLDAQREDGTFERSWSLAETNAIFRCLLATFALPTGSWADARQRVVERSVGYLRESQNPDGGWGQRPGKTSDATSTAYGLIASAHFGPGTMHRRALTWLRTNQLAHGGFVASADQAGPRPLAYDVPSLPDHFALIALNHAMATANAEAHQFPRSRPSWPIREAV